MDKESDIKLTIELIPRTSFFKNVRSEVSASEWKKIKTEAYRRANYKCEICGGTGPKWPVECHEVFEYNTDDCIQKLIRLIALCPSCHEVKHIGLAQIKGRYEKAKKHLRKVNNWTDQRAEKYISECFALWEKRNNTQWQLDLTNLKNYT